MRDAVLAGVLAGYGIAVPVGAVAVYLVTLSAQTSLRAGVSAALGVAAVDGGYALAAVLGGAALARRVQPVAEPLRLLSVTVLLVLAVRTAVAATHAYRARGRPRRPDSARLGPARACARLAAATAMNPVTVVYFAALVGARAAVPLSFGERLAFAAAACLASASWQLLLAGGGALLGRALTGARARLVTGLTSSAVVVLLALRLA